VRRGALVALACGALLGGCGGGDDDESGTNAGAAPSTGQAAALAKKCGQPAPVADAKLPDEVPAGVLPDDAALMRSEAGRTVLLIPGEIGAVYGKLASNAKASGIEIEFQELETHDAELELKNATGVARFELESIADCGDVTRVVVQQRQG
jgi:hypothetical protein